MNEREPAGKDAADERGESATASNPGPGMTVESPWARPADHIIHTFDVSLDEGLSSSEARRRHQRYGPNRLRTAQTRSALSILIEQFKSVIIALLAAAAVVSFAFGELVEALAIGVVIVINAAIGFVTELRAIRAMEALQELTRVDSKVRRDGQVQELEAQDIVPGDIVLVDGGDIVTADLRLFEASKLQADESPLTGESTPVRKQTEPVEEDAPLAERASMLFKGTAVTRGSGKGVVVTTGMETELGNVSSLVEEAQEEKTPLERRLSQLGHRLIWVTMGVAALVTLSGILRGRELLLMIRSGLALAVASIPEGLPIVATVALARGMWRMARRNAVVNRLSAVETLGSTSVILTDKTGTLTENRMTVTQLVLPSDDGTDTRVNVSGEGLELDGEFTRDDGAIDPRDDDRLRRALEVGVLCNNATIQGYGPDEEPSSVGEPTEIALLVAGAKGGIHRDELTERMPEQREVAFDPEVKMMATFHERPDGNNRFLVAVKGGVEAVIQRSNRILTENGTRELNDEQRQAWIQRGEELAQEGLRILAAATGQADSMDEDPYQDLTFVGLYALLDPPRQEIQDAIAAVRKAGIRVVMVTGDQPATARYVARAVGLLDEGAVVVHGGNIGTLKDLPDEEQQRILQASVLARVAPEQKLDLIALHQESGAIVAMTGDGVNDAPALKKADIGVAMGERGTQVAREAADMVLKDDNFSTIVEAIRQGRNIFKNIRKFVLYLLSCNGAEIVVVGLASVADAPLPIRPLQILFLNLVTDVFPALALGVGKGDPHILDRPPRDPEEQVLTRRHWLSIAGYSAMIGAVVLGTLAIAIFGLGMSEAKAVTVSFLTLAFAQLWHVFNMRDRDAGLINNDVVQNGWVWAALALCTVLLLAAVYVPGLANVLRVEDPGTQGWVLILGMSLSPLMLSAAAEALRAI